MDENVDQKERKKHGLGISPSFVVVMTTFIDMIGYGMIIPILPFHPETAGAGALALGLLIGSFSFMQFIFAPLLGRLSDKMGRRPVILISILSSLVSFIIFALADSFLLLLLSRITAGMATESALAQAYISDITTEKERAKGMGKVGAAHGAGFIIGPAIGGLLSIYGVSALGFAAAALTGVNLLFAFFFLPETKAHTNSDVQTFKKTDEGYWRRLATAITKSSMSSVFVILFLTTLAFSAIPVVVPLLGIAFFGFTELETSYFFMYIGVVQIVLQGLLIGRLAKRLGEELLIVLGSISMMIGMLFMPLFPNILVFLVALTLMSSGIGTLNTVLPSFISKKTSSDEQGGMLGVAQSVGSVARVPGPLIGGFIAEFAGLNVALSLSAVIVLCAVVLGFKVFQVHKFRGRPTEEISH